MPAALLKLLWLKTRGSIRRAIRVQGNPKRLILLVIGLVALVLWLGPMVFFAARSGQAPTDLMATYGPLVLAAFTIFSLLASTGETAIAFQPAEVDLLFPGPFTRRQLLAYKLLSGMVASLFGALIFSFAFLKHAGSWPTAFVGFVLTLWFIQFLGTGLALIKQMIGEMAYTRGRRLAIGLVLLALVVALIPLIQGKSYQDVPTVIREINESTAGRIVLAPFRVFTSLIASRTLVDALRWGASAVGIITFLAWLVLRLDADYLEASIRASERFAERIRRARSGNMLAPASGGNRAARSRHAAGAWLGGAAPIVWRQSTTLLRTGKRWVFQIVIMFAAAGFILASLRRIEAPGAGVGIGIGLLAYLTVILTSMLRFDFRADLDHLETLKSLPLDPRAIALGEILLPAILLAAVQSLLVVAATVIFDWPSRVVIAVAAAIPVVNIILLGVENLLFLMFPARLSNRGVADFSLIGRQMLLFMGKVLIFGAIGAIAAGVAFALKTATGSWEAGLFAAWIVLAIAAAAAVLATGRAFKAFDVSADMPA